MVKKFGNISIPCITILLSFGKLGPPRFSIVGSKSKSMSSHTDFVSINSRNLVAALSPELMIKYKSKIS